MKTVGLITEYNPFHNGHLYHIERARELTGADRVVIVMSGDYVQRGTPALLSKHSRAHMALLNGASAICELPVCYASGSAESFAQGASLFWKVWDASIHYALEVNAESFLFYSILHSCFSPNQILTAICFRMH